MEKFEITINLEHVAAQRKAWNDAANAFGESVNRTMKRLIHEAAAARMSVPEVAKLSGFTTAQIKSRMKSMNLNPTTGKTLLSKQAAAVLESNAEILGIQPHEIDLMSPLAYLPAGPAIKEQVKGIHELELETAFPETKRTLADLIEELKQRGGTRFHIKGEAYEIRVEALWADRERWGLGMAALELLAQADEAGA